MLEIRLDIAESTPLQLNPGTSIQITESRPIFDKDSIDRKFSLPFRLPLTPLNKRLRKHSNRLDAANKTASIPATVRFAGNLILAGNMSQTSVSNTEEEVSIANDPLKIWEKLGKIKINEILESFDLLIGRPAPLWEFGMGVTGHYEFNIGTVMAGATADTFPEIPTAGASIASQINAVYPGTANYNAGTNRLEVDSFLVFGQNGFTSALFVISAYENIAMYRYHAVRDHVLDTNATPLESHCFPLIKWAGMPGLRFYTIVNNVINGVMLENVDMTTSTVLTWENSIVPCVRIPYILKKIGEALGDYVWAGPVWDDEDFQKLVHVPNVALDEVTEDLQDDYLHHKRNTFKPFINLNDLTPAMSAADFIKKLCTTFGLYLDPADQSLSLIKKQTPLQEAAFNLDSKIGTNFTVEPNTVAGWKLAMAINANDLKADPAQLNSVVTGLGEYLVETSTTLFMGESVLASTTGDIIKCAVTNQPGRSPAFDPSATKSTTPLTLLFCHENQPNNLGHDYIFASHDGINYDGDTVGEYSLSPEGEFGLYERWHKGVIEYSTANMLKITAYLHVGEVQKLLKGSVARVAFYHPEGTVIAAIKSIQVSAKSQGIEATRLELLYQ